MRLKGLFVAVIALVMLSACSESALDKLNGYRGAEWGMSPDEVSRIGVINAQRNSYSPKNEVRGRIESQGYVFDLPDLELVPAAFVYYDNALFLVELEEDGISGEQVESVIASLEAKYGKPKRDIKTDSERHENSFYRNLNWVGKKTVIHLYLSTTDSKEYYFSLQYYSRKAQKELAAYYDTEEAKDLI